MSAAAHNRPSFRRCLPGVQVTDSTLMALAEGANCDIRLVLGQLQMVRLRARALSYDEVKVSSPGLRELHDAFLSAAACGARVLDIHTAPGKLLGTIPPWAKAYAPIALGGTTNAPVSSLTDTEGHEPGVGVGALGPCSRVACQLPAYCDTHSYKHTFRQRSTAFAKFCLHYRGKIRWAASLRHACILRRPLAAGLQQQTGLCCLNRLAVACAGRHVSL